MRSSWMRMGTKFNDECPSKRQKGGDRHTEEEAREGGGRGWNDVSTSQGTPRIASSPQKPGERWGTGSPAEPPEGTKPAEALIWAFRPPVSHAVKGSLGAALSRPVLGQSPTPARRRDYCFLLKTAVALAWCPLLPNRVY